MKKKIPWIILAVVIIAAAILLFFKMKAPDTAAPAAILSIDNVTASANDEVSMEIRVSDLGSRVYPAASFVFRFDNTHLEFLSLGEGDLMLKSKGGDKLPSWCVNPDKANESGTLSIMYLDTTGGEEAFHGDDSAKNSTVFRLKFRLRDNAKSGEMYGIVCSDAVFAADDESESLSMAAGTLIVSNGSISVSGSSEASEKPAEVVTDDYLSDVKPEKLESAGNLSDGRQVGQDMYLTDPIPEGKPLPVEPENAEKTGNMGTCTISISCSTILDNMDLCDPDKIELVPSDGWILSPVTVSFEDGESVFDVLQRVTRENGIHMEFEFTPIYNSAYIEGIHNLYEFDVGNLSGWMYKVNEWFPNYGCSRYAVCDGDVIAWVYTCDLGYDVGGGYAVGG